MEIYKFIFYTEFMSENQNWVYKYSENLKQNIAYNKTTGWVHCEDGTEYSPQEFDIIKKTGAQIPFQVHLAKKVFEGQLVL